LRYPDTFLAEAGISSGYVVAPLNQLVSSRESRETSKKVTAPSQPCARPGFDPRIGIG
jgi:hypothetical protein